MSESTASVATLMQAHRHGDPFALSRLLEMYKADLWGFLVNRLPSNFDADDLYQDICMKVLRHVNELREPDRFRSWLFSIAMNTVRSHYRRKPIATFDPQTLLNDPGLTSAAPTAQFALEQRERRRQLKHCLDRLPERDREVLLLDVMAELPQQDIATQMELNLNTVKTILRRTKIKLARMMVEVAHG